MFYALWQGDGIQDLALACPVKSHRATLLQAGFNWASINTAPGVDEFPVLAKPFFGALHIVFLQPKIPGQELILAAGPESVAQGRPPILLRPVHQTGPYEVQIDIGQTVLPS